MKLVPLRDVMLGDVRPIMLMLLSGAALLLLIACINVVSLLLARSDSRTREIAVRNALGASSARLMLQFATEALILVITAAVLGLTLATWGTRLLGGLLSADMISRMPYLQGIGLNVRLIAVTCVPVRDQCDGVHADAGAAPVGSTALGRTERGDSRLGR